MSIKCEETSNIFTFNCHHVHVSCVIEIINKAKAKRNIDEPLILHSNRGSQYVSKEYKRVTATM